MSFAEALRVARLKKGLSMFATAQLAGIAAPIYRMIEAGKIHPDREKLDAVCKVLDFSWFESDDASPEDA